jgi:hypothetical protein
MEFYRCVYDYRLGREVFRSDRVQDDELEQPTLWMPAPELSIEALQQLIEYKNKEKAEERKSLEAQAACLRAKLADIEGRLGEPLP